MANSLRSGRVVSLLKEMMTSGRSCPAHSNCSHGSHLLMKGGKGLGSMTPQALSEYAFEMACSNVRYGNGVTKEIGMDVVQMNAKKVLLMTDKGMSKLPPFTAVCDSLTTNKVNFDVFDEVSIEPSDGSMQLAVDFARRGNYDLFIALGGGSVIDTCKAANLLAADKEGQLLDYVPKPIGAGKIVQHVLKPLIAVPTTAGTGSETTGVAVFDYKEKKMKIGIGSRALRPTLGIIDPDHTRHMPTLVTAYSGFDVLSHAVESYTALPYTERPRPSSPAERPAYQGSNPISDVWCKHALHIVAKYFRRAVKDADDIEARSAMHLASCFAGIGFGNAGVHLPHGMSYPVSGLVRNYKCPSGYPMEKALIPHGLSVIVNAPAVFRFTADACPERHLEAAEILDPIKAWSKKREDAGGILADVILSYMSDMDVPDGLTGLGYTAEDIPALVKGTLPQHRVTKLAPQPAAEEDLTHIFTETLKVY